MDQKKLNKVIFNLVFLILVMIFQLVVSLNLSAVSERKAYQTWWLVKTTMFNWTSANFVDTLRTLIELDFDAIAAYEVALAHLRSKTLQRPLRQFIDEYERHIRELIQLLLSYQDKIIKLSLSS